MDMKVKYIPIDADQAPPKKSADTDLEIKN